MPGLALSLGFQAADRFTVRATVLTVLTVQIAVPESSKLKQDSESATNRHLNESG